MINLYWNDLRRIHDKEVSHLYFEGWDFSQMENIRESAPQSAHHVVATQSVLVESEVFIVLLLGPGFVGQALDPSSG